jgi:mono/diheme cytochrome c family protein
MSHSTRRAIPRLPALIVALAAAFIAAGASAAQAEVNYASDVAPIMMKHCVSCHRPGEIAPMSLLTYDDARPWATSIREAVVTRKMPPWQADPGHGKFRNDISLSQREIDTVVQWVDGGARRGDLKKMPPAPKFAEGWQMGEPDLVVDLDELTVPESGPDVFLDLHKKVSLPDDRWIRAVEIRPGNRKVLHHLVTFLGWVEMSGTPGGRAQRPGGGPSDPPRILSIWAAGTPPTVFPDGMGHPVKKEADLTFNVHLHPYGEKATDHTKVGIYFGSGELKSTLRTGFAVNTGILIPPGSDGTESKASHVFSQDCQVISLFPHMHFRGKSMRFELTYPDGRRDVLLDVPKYDFNWQWLYYPEKALEVPKGSRLDVVARWDNSTGNRSNPDPSRTVEFGEGTDSEMLIGFFEYTNVTTEKPKTMRERLDVLLAAHPEASSYVLDVNAGMAAFNWGIDIPKEGPGTFYLLEREQTLTITLRDIVWNGQDVTLSGKLIRGAGRTIPMGVRARVTESGEITGKLFIGNLVTGPEDPKGPSLPFKGKRRDAAPVSAAAR